MSGRIVTNLGVEEVSDTEFFARIFGHAPRSKAEREAEHRTKCERYADMIEQGADWGIPPPYLFDARAIIAERQQLTEVRGDPLLRKDAA